MKTQTTANAHTLMIKAYHEMVRELDLEQENYNMVKQGQREGIEMKGSLVEGRLYFSNSVIGKSLIGDEQFARGRVMMFAEVVKACAAYINFGPVES